MLSTNQYTTRFPFFFFFSFLILFLLSSMSYATEPFESSSSSDFKALWWNIGYHHKQVQNNLDDNLEMLSAQNYDLIALGEAILNNVSQKTKQVIKKTFPYRAYQKYGILKKNGIWILSKHRFDLRMRNIDWAPVGSSLSQRDNYIENSEEFYGNVESFYRKQSHVYLNKNGREYNFIFYHLSNPWITYKNKTNKYLTAWEILVGDDNPVTNQISHLRENLKKQFGSGYSSMRVVSMGDSNCPRKVKGVATYCYRNLVRTLPIVLDKQIYFTYPAGGNSEYEIKIDHAQASRVFRHKELKVLKLEGSDHYPLSLFLWD